MKKRITSLHIRPVVFAAQPIIPVVEQPSWVRFPFLAIYKRQINQTSTYSQVKKTVQEFYFPDDTYSVYSFERRYDELNWYYGVYDESYRYQVQLRSRRLHFPSLRLAMEFRETVGGMVVG